MLTVYMVSDATGETAERITRSALAQFQEADVSLVRRGQVDTPQQVRAVVADAARDRALMAYTLVSNELRGLMLTECRLRGVDAVDLLGSLLDRFTVHLGVTPQEKPGLFQQLNEARLREIETFEFAKNHDDGQRPDDLHRAEIVLVGVSRTMKTPTTYHLAFHGWFVANVPLVPELPLPEPLLAVPPQRVFCLLLQPDQLRQRRQVRANLEAIPLEPYASAARVAREHAYAEQLCRQHGWRRIEVTGQSVEEVARAIITLASASQLAGGPHS